jgi:class 3 adenylate cyclase
MDAAGFERATICGIWDSCITSMVFAAQHPARVEGLVLLSPFAQGYRSAPFKELAGWDSPDQVEAYDRAWQDIFANWGRGESIRLEFPELATPRHMRVWGCSSARGRVPRCSARWSTRLLRPGCAEQICAAADGLDLRVRAGLHTGECEVIEDDVAGIAVHIAARVSAEAGPGEVLVSRTVRDLVTGSGIALQSRGERELKGVPGSWELFAVGSETTPLPAPDQTRDLRTSDRLVLLAARRAPALLRAANRISTRRDHG